MMENAANHELVEFQNLAAAIRNEAAALKNTVLSEEEEKEANDILSAFGSAIKTQSFSTLNNIILYQMRGWKEVLYE